MTTETHSLSLLCPKEVLYLNLPRKFLIYLKNQGVSIGCYYFLNPVGNDAKKVQIHCKPNSGILCPGQSVTIEILLTPLETGIFDDLYVPCFTGNNEEMLSLRILCAVDGINVNIHLPINKDKQKIFLWPPRSELELDWNFSMNGEEEGGENTVYTPKEIDEEYPLDDLMGPNAVGLHYPTVNIGQIETYKPVQITFYIENISPLSGHFSVQATNYNFIQTYCNKLLVQSRIKRINEEWDKECGLGYGIIVQTSRPYGDLVGYEVVEIDLFIYATTWGKYLEEIMVEINDLTPFCFNLVIDVVGMPLEFPFSKNTILEGPVLRFGNLSYCSGSHTRSLRVINTSSIPLIATWHIFDCSQQDKKPFNFIFDVYQSDTNSFDKFSSELTTRSFGSEFGKALIIEPTENHIDKHSSAMINITIDTNRFESQEIETNLKYNLVAVIHIDEQDKFKENYFRRKSGSVLEKLCLYIEIVLERPMLLLDLHKEDSIMNLFVNDLFYQLIEPPHILLTFRNNDKSSILFTVDIEKPFKILKTSIRPNNESLLEIPSGSAINLTLTCHLSHELLFEFSDFIYRDKSGNRLETVANFESVITKNLNIHQVGVRSKHVPFEIRLHYPEIDVQPAFIKFGPCLLYKTQKTVLTIVNMSSSLAYFEIYKTQQDDVFFIKPNCGFIPGSTGQNHQFVDLFVYFTPKEPHQYEETIRITTNMPAYYKDIPVVGHGTINEKFYKP